MVSEPPRPSVVMSLVFCDTPWKPATIGIAPSASAEEIRPGVTSMIRRRAVHVVGDDAGLRAGEGARLHAQGGDRHGEQRHRDALTGGQQHVKLAPGRRRGHLVRQVEQLVRGVAHRGHDHHDLVARLLSWRRCA